MLKYKGYMGSIEFSLEDRVLHGQIVGIRDLVTYEGETISELEKAFRDSVDDYVDFCKREGLEPKKPLSGRINLRMGPEIHWLVAAEAEVEGKSLNTFLVEIIRQAVEGESNRPSRRPTRKSRSKKAANE